MTNAKLSQQRFWHTGLSRLILIHNKGNLTCVGYNSIRLNMPVLIAGPKPLLTEFCMHYRSESLVSHIKDLWWTRISFRYKAQNWLEHVNEKGPGTEDARGGISRVSKLCPITQINQGQPTFQAFSHWRSCLPGMQLLFSNTKHNTQICDENSVSIGFGTAMRTDVGMHQILESLDPLGCLLGLSVNQDFI